MPDATTPRMLPTVRTPDGSIYADLGNAQLRKIPSLTEYQAGVAAGQYSGTPRQITATPAPGAGGQTYLGGYEVGDPGTGADNFATSSRTIAGNAVGSPAGKAETLKNTFAQIISGGNTAPGAPAQASYADQIATKRQEAARLQTEAFTTATEYTPTELRNLTPGQQAELRRQRVTAIAGQLGNVQAAIASLKDEETRATTAEEAARSKATDTLNTYLKYGILDQIDPTELEALGAASGLSSSALEAIAAQASTGEPPELREVGGNLYSVSWNPETGTFDTNLVVAKQGGGSGGSSGSGVSGSGSRETLTQKELNTELDDYPQEFKSWYKATFPGSPSTRAAIGAEYQRYLTTSDHPAKSGSGSSTSITKTFPDGSSFTIGQ